MSIILAVDLLCLIMENYVTLSDCGQRQRENSRFMSLKLKYSRPEPIDRDSLPKRDKSGKPLKKKPWERVRRRRRRSIKGAVSQTKTATQTLSKYSSTLSTEQKRNLAKLRRYFPPKKHNERKPIDMSSLVLPESQELKACKATIEDGIVRLTLTEKTQGKKYYSVRSILFEDCEVQWMRKEQWLREQGFRWVE